MWERIKCVIIKEFKQIFRDPRIRILIFISPLVQLFLFGYAAVTDVKHVPTAVYDLDLTPQSREIIRKFAYSEYFDVRSYLKNEQEINKIINKGTVDLVIRINQQYSRDLLAGREAQIQFIIDGTDSNKAGIIQSYIEQIISRYSYSFLYSNSAKLLKGNSSFAQVDLRSRAWFNPDLKATAFYLPGVIAMIISIMSLLLTALAVVREKEIGTIEQLLVSPLKPSELILGKILPFALLVMVQVIMITAIGLLWFRIPFRGSVLFLLLSIIIYLLTSSGIGILISTISSSQQEAMMATFLFFLPAVLLSGFVFPLENMPVIIQYLTFLNPLRYLMTIIRGIFLKGVGLNTLWPQILALTTLGLLVFSTSTLKFKKYIK